MILAHVMRERLQEALVKDGKVLGWQSMPRTYIPSQRRRPAGRTREPVRAQAVALQTERDRKKRENQEYYQNGTSWHMPRGRTSTSDFGGTRGGGG